MRTPAGCNFVKESWLNKRWQWLVSAPAQWPAGMLQSSPKSPAIYFQLRWMVPNLESCCASHLETHPFPFWLVSAWPHAQDPIGTPKAHQGTSLDLCDVISILLLLPSIRCNLQATNAYISSTIYQKAQIYIILFNLLTPSLFHDFWYVIFMGSFINKPSCKLLPFELISGEEEKLRKR